MEQIFPKNLDELDYSNKDDCIKKLEDYIRYMKERCEFMMQGLTPTGVMNRVKMNGIDAGIISTGVLQSQDGQTFVLDLNNNTLNADFDSLKIGTKTAATEEYATTQDTASWNNKTQEDVFLKLTNGGDDQGIYISDQKVYINGEYIKANSLLASQVTVTGGGDAQTALNTAQNTASDAKGKTDGLANGTTTISGGCIKTGTIDASIANITNINASNITTGVIQSSDSEHKYSLNLNTGAVTMKSANITGGSINMQGTSTWSGIKLQNGSNTNYYSSQSPIGLMVRNSDNGHQTNYYGGGVVCSDYSTDRTRMYISPEDGLRFWDASGNLMAYYNPDARNNIRGFVNYTYTFWSYVNFDASLVNQFSGFQIVLTVNDENGRTLASTYVPSTHCWREHDSWQDPDSAYDTCWAKFDSDHIGYAAFEKVGNSYRIYAKVTGSDSRVYVYGVR